MSSSNTYQLTLPNVLQVATGGGTATMTVPCNTYSTGIFSFTLSANMTALALTSPRTGGQYVVYITSSGSFTINGTTSTLSGARCNYNSVALTINQTAIMTITWDGNIVYAACSLYA